jgi:hypothetical protein
MATLTRLITAKNAAMLLAVRGNCRGQTIDLLGAL